MSRNGADVRGVARWDSSGEARSALRTTAVSGLFLLACSPLITPVSAATYALLVSTLMAFVGAATCSLAARRTTARKRSGWGLLALACLGWGLGNAYWSWNELIAHATVLFPSAADAGFLVFPVAATAGLWLISGRSSLGFHLASLLDGLIVTGSLFVVSWATTLRSVYEAGADTPAGFAVSLAYPLGDLVLVTMMFLLTTRTRRGGRVIIVLLITGLLGMTVADTLFALETAAGSYVSGSPSDAGWVVGFASIALAGRATARRPMALDDAGLVRSWQLLLPYGPFSVAVAICGAQVLQGRVLDTVQTLATLGVFALVLARQLMTLRHNSTLTERLRHQAFHDPLTGLANRTLFFDRLENALETHARGGGPRALIYLDLDDFKLVNDTMGHDTGDELLRRVAERMLSCFGPGDTVARLGGDEFAVLVAYGDDPVPHARRLLDSLCHPFALGGRTVRPTASIGIATTWDIPPTTGDRPPTWGRTASEDLRKYVDLAMYAAKAQGKNTYAVFEPSMQQRFDQEMTLRAELARALDEAALRDEPALYVMFQPIVDLTDGRVIAVEALARWRHPTMGEVAPTTFIAVAERAGLITGVGSFVLDRACAQFTRWADDSDAYLSVNVSPLQLLDPTLPDQVTATLARHGLRPDRLVLEVTESALADESDVVTALHRLRDSGVRIAIDDFGTGYSSLRYLHRFPVDIIKIDRSYVTGVADDPADARLVSSLWQLFAGLGLTAVAEGVETAAQARALHALGCPSGQGFLFSRPVAADELPSPGHALRPGISHLAA